jgi:hypothetical protein
MAMVEVDSWYNTKFTCELVEYLKKKSDVKRQSSIYLGTNGV